MKFTEDVVRAITNTPGKTDQVFFDDELPGFGLRVRAGGAKSWMIQYAIGRRTRRVVIGTTTLFKYAEARERARKLLAKVRLGGDPAAEKKKAFNVGLEERVVRKALTFLQQNIEPECYLYRHYHPSGELLYVGVSLEPLRRPGQSSQESNLARHDLPHPERAIQDARRGARGRRDRHPHRIPQVQLHPQHAATSVPRIGAP